jgi:hypothetical protein
MRAILVAAMVALVAMAAPAFAGGITDDTELRMHRNQTSRAAETRTAAVAPATRDVVVEEYHSAGAEFGLGIASTVLSLIYFPPRAIFGLVGAELGGFGGWSTGGDLRTGKALWRPTVEGDYFIRPDHLDGTEHFDVINTTPVFHGRYTVHEVSTYVPPPAERPDEERYEDPDDLDVEPSSARDSDERVVEEHARELTTDENDQDDPSR